MNSLDLYAKIEPLIGFYEEYERLYELYIEILQTLQTKTVLDIGCGNGSMLLKLKKSDFKALGVDKSEEMIKIARKKGVKAIKKDLCSLNEKFDAVIAVGDVVNYMQKEDLKNFFKCAKDVLKKEGYFILDINTLFGFEEVTQGVMIKDTKDGFLAIDASFEDGILDTFIYFFQKEGECYKKEEGRIFQYFYRAEDIEKLSGMQVKNIKKVSLFSETEPDKEIIILKNV